MVRLNIKDFTRHSRGYPLKIFFTQRCKYSIRVVDKHKQQQQSKLLTERFNQTTEFFKVLSKKYKDEVYPLFAV